MKKTTAISKDHLRMIMTSNAPNMWNRSSPGAWRINGLIQASEADAPHLQRDALVTAGSAQRDIFASLRCRSGGSGGAPGVGAAIDLLSIFVWSMRPSAASRLIWDWL